MLSRVGLRPLARFPLRSAAFSAVRASSTSTVKVSHDQEQELLVNQRKNRPVSPHLTIYTPQITMVLSGLNRITGVAMAGAFYALTCGYAATSLLSIPFDSAVLVSAFAGLPFAAKLAAKAAMSFPFVFHSLNGVRHLVWDFGKELTISGVNRTGYAVVAATAALGSWMIFW
ncbi:cytochrome b560 subunit of succinate dehydrogenase [Metschnikowia bicuspidata var. bicuspidata NRRL YB-4993]|uniref:Cytochrome b560 subunit of succinate dehydrogenase n=1 Tax=Metschnikowia bicuspidata var. bicuspidata NRRL YB-4993 TaxID=869754 RepID=A0A1A0HG47_9ASCO|nr:cytochrome b560 subunit of succinate dehydrogenase [Metschnikowia bicuspidata var. bicuspidata NRRL YB-4993]OBA23134.1 cytochrome b560 subunit of succinate dehydrogenase [Metschnikowia bicuspidata var. bicuspidata NRRL YB-4993]